MINRIKQRVSDLVSLLSADDVAIEYEDIIDGKKFWTHDEVISGGMLIMAVLDARYTMYRIKQFINLLTRAK